MATKKKPSAKQLAARAKFIAMVRAKSKAKKSAVKKAAPKKKVSGLDKIVRRGSKTDVKYSKMSGIESQLSRNINGRTYVCQFITSDQHKAKIKVSAYKEIGISARIIKLSKDKRPVYGVFVD